MVTFSTFLCPGNPCAIVEKRLILSEVLHNEAETMRIGLGGRLAVAEREACQKRDISARSPGHGTLLKVRKYHLDLISHTAHHKKRQSNVDMDLSIFISRGLGYEQL